MRPLALALMALALFSSARPARAAGRAEELFERGVTAFLAGKFDVGCPLIEQSHGLDPLPGVLFTLAECQFGWGKAKTAADNYNKFLDTVGRLPAAEASKHAERAAVAIRKRAEAVRNIAGLTVRVRGDWIPGTRVSLDGRDVTLMLGKRIELDPGSHSVVMVEPGRSGIRQKISLAPAESEVVELVVAPPTPTAQPELAKEEPAAETPSPRKPTAAYVLGGFGLVGVAIGSVTGLMAQGEKSSIEDNCPNRVCNSEGREAVDRGQSLATISTISFAIGLAGLGGATYLFLRPSSATSTERAGPRVSVALGARPALAFTTSF